MRSLRVFHKGFDRRVVITLKASSNSYCVYPSINECKYPEFNVFTSFNSYLC